VPLGNAAHSPAVAAFPRHPRQASARLRGRRRTRLHWLCQWRWLDQPPGGSVNQVDRRSPAVPASPAFCASGPAGLIEGVGVAVPFRTGTAERSIFGILLILMRETGCLTWPGSCSRSPRCGLLMQPNARDHLRAAAGAAFATTAKAVTDQADSRWPPTSRSTSAILSSGGSAVPTRRTSDGEKRLTSKHPQNDLANVLRRSTPQSDPWRHDRARIVS
jgi:hypothetical protein